MMWWQETIGRSSRLPLSVSRPPEHSLPAHLLADLPERRARIEQLGVHLADGCAEKPVENVVREEANPPRVEDDHRPEHGGVEPEAGPRFTTWAAAVSRSTKTHGILRTFPIGRVVHGPDLGDDRLDLFGWWPCTLAILEVSPVTPPLWGLRSGTQPAVIGPSPTGRLLRGPWCATMG